MLNICEHKCNLGIFTGCDRSSSCRRNNAELLNHWFGEVLGGNYQMVKNSGLKVNEDKTEIRPFHRKFYPLAEITLISDKVTIWEYCLGYLSRGILITDCTNSTCSLLITSSPWQRYKALHLSELRGPHWRILLLPRKSELILALYC